MAIVESQKIDQKLSQILGLDRKNQKAIALSSIDSDEHQIGAPTPASAPIHERDLLSQFKMNLDKVESLNRRLKFVLGEVEQVMRKY